MAVSFITTDVLLAGRLEVLELKPNDGMLLETWIESGTPTSGYRYLLITRIVHDKLSLLLPMGVLQAHSGSQSTIRLNK